MAHQLVSLILKMVIMTHGPAAKGFHLMLKTQRIITEKEGERKSETPLFKLLLLKRI